MPNKTHLDLTNLRLLNQEGRMYHVFATARDEWTEDIGEALSIAGEYLADGEVGIRIYVEDYESEEAKENDEYDEDCLLAIGPYPN